MTHRITEHLRPSPVDFVPGTIEAQKEVIATLTRERDAAQAEADRLRRDLAIATSGQGLKPSDVAHPGMGEFHQHFMGGSK